MIQFVVGPGPRHPQETLLGIVTTGQQQGFPKSGVVSVSNFYINTCQQMVNPVHSIQTKDNCNKDILIPTNGADSVSNY